MARMTTHLHHSDHAAAMDLAHRLASKHGRRQQVRPCRRVPLGMCWVVSEVWG